MCEDNRPICVILGGGGHAKVLIDSLQCSGAARPFAVLDVNESRWGADLQGIPVIGNDKMLPDLISRGVDSFAVGLGSVGDNSFREMLFHLGLSYGLQPLTIIHPSVVCSKWAEIGTGSQLLPGSIVNAAAVVGQNVIINSGAIVEHDCQIADHAHIATRACLASTVSIGRGAHIGAGSVVRQLISIGEGAVIGAGSVVVKDVPPHMVMVGVPAREIANGSEFQSAVRSPR
jgi:UDP-perosamine 4-acetyltransferase